MSDDYIKGKIIYAISVLATMQEDIGKELDRIYNMR